MSCKHKRFLAKAHVERMEDDKDFRLLGYTFSAQVQCADCQTFFKFVAPNVTFSLNGLTIGKDPKRPDAPDDSLLAVPIEPVEIAQVEPTPENVTPMPAPAEPAPEPFVPEVLPETQEIKKETNSWIGRALKSFRPK